MASGSKKGRAVKRRPNSTGPGKDLQMLSVCEEALILGKHRECQAMLIASGAASQRTVSRYFRSIRDRWAQEEVELRGERRGEFRARLQASFNVSMETKNGMAMAAVMRSWAKFDGMEVPLEIRVSGGIDVKAMSPTERSREIDRLIALRSAALGPKVIDVEEAKPKRLKAKRKAAG